ncbi:MAG: hypothetical protein WD379_02650 [Dehalococcoidia bacterium]
MRNPRFALVLASLSALALLALLVAACSSGGGGDTPTPVETEAPEETPTEDEPASEDTVQVGESFWHSGWKVTLGEASLVPGDFGSVEVTIEATFENLSDTEATFDSTLVLVSGGQNYTDSSFTQDLPRVPGGLSGEGVIAFSVDEEFNFDDATLIIGASSNNQAIVPLGPQGQDLVTLEPREIAIAGDVTAGAVMLTVERGELRADIASKLRPIEAGKLSLTIFFSATPSAGIQLGQGVLGDENVKLKLPDGTTVAIPSDGISGVNALLQGAEGTTIPDLSVRFEIPDPPEGDYALVLTGNYGGGGDSVEGELPFTIEPATP